MATSEIDRSSAGELMPAANVRDLDGKVLNLGALQGGPVLVNLWATWCAPCVKEMPLLDELAGDYEGRMRVIAISQDMGDESKVADFFAQGGFEHLHPWIDPQAELSFALGGAALPVTVLYDGLGQEVFRVTGDFDWASEEARAAIDEALAR